MPKKSNFAEPLALAVASGSTIKAAAAQIGCSDRTAYNLSCQPEFRQRVSELRTEVTAAAVGRLTDVSLQAVNTLAELLSPDQPANIRCTAAKAILASLIPMGEALELRERIAELERSAALKVVG